jgi:putative SOS response-associated peptidase YedK
MTRRDGGVLAFAGLWTVWGDRLLTCTIVTTAAVGDLALVHDRMPLLLPPDRWPEWLSGDAAATLLQPPGPATVSELEIRPVGRAVGDVRNDGPELVAAVPAAPLGGSAAQTLDLTLF